MFSFLTRSWWIPFIAGIIAIIFAFFAMVMPRATISALLIVFAVFLLVQGGFLIYSGLRGRERGPLGTGMIISGIIIVIVGIWTIVATESAAEVLIIVMGAWAIALGLWTLVSSLSIRHVIEQWWLSGIAGIGLIIAGVLVIAQPWVGVTAISLSIGFGALLWGTLLTWIGWLLRAINHNTEPDNPTIDHRD
ncbi:HdeD family acid-resistance protein [Flaviflexus massiliensis]|uniref:HdeD family acid-resistance protein n=1 Tax=Flaviflexus massiliensis TaxID=1522309 RepID=UPI0006D579EF|nr:DUF308 domain-containing protein [Flaviflexus massiliensis]